MAAWILNTMFFKDKDRLYVALYVRGGTIKMPGGEDKFVPYLSYASCY